ncbi:MAG: FKBP-type peptidyl-prolyl cis-trans isomerase [Leptothrix sp. (in: b-proteobacteria)]
MTSTFRLHTLAAAALALGAALSAPAWAAEASVDSPADAPAVAPTGAARAPAASTLSPKQKLSYATGVSAIRNFIKNEVEFDLEQVIQGMRDAQAGKELVLGEKEMRVVMNQLQTDLRRNMVANQKELGEKNRKRGADFLAAYKQKPGTLTLSNGVAYRIAQAGTGPMPSELDTVIVKYRGATVDGTEFDATEDGKTSALRVNQVVMGWREAIKRMPVGSKWEVVIPSQLAYGERGVGASIGPNETLVFDIELFEIKK